MPGIDFAKLRTVVSIGDVLALLDFVPAKSAGPQLRGPCPLHGSENPKSLSFSVNLGKKHVPVFHLQEGRKPLGPLGGSNSEAPFRGRTRAMSTPQPRCPLEGNTNREEEPVKGREGSVIALTFSEIRIMT